MCFLGFQGLSISTCCGPKLKKDCQHLVCRKEQARYSGKALSRACIPNKNYIMYLQQSVSGFALAKRVHWRCTAAL